MSCRAFSRRIEFLCLTQLFQQFKPQDITFDFMQTPKNGPMREFLSVLLTEPCLALTHDAFAAECPKLYQKVIENHGQYRSETN